MCSDTNDDRGQDYENLPLNKDDAVAKALRMCERAFGTERGPFFSVPWRWTSKIGGALYAKEAQEAMVRFMDQHRIDYAVIEGAPSLFVLF